MATAIAYAALRIGYTGEVISADTHDLASTIILYGSVLGGAATAGVLGSRGASAPFSVLAGLAPPVGMCLGSLGTVILGIGYYDASPAILFIGLLLFCSVVNVVAWIIGSRSS